MNIEQLKKWDIDWSERFPIRLTKKQKERFLEELEKELQDRHFETERVNTRSLVILNRSLVTKCKKPRVIFLAHYDTPTIMPAWGSILFRFFGHTRQIMGLFFVLALLLTPSFVPFFSEQPQISTFMSIISVALLVTSISTLIPNPHNREDNTSGVIGLMALADWAKDKPHIKEHIQFVFLDNEELGLLGSNGVKRLWNKQQHPYSDAAIVCLDCVSRGQKPLIVYHKNDAIAQRVMPFLQEHLPEAKKIDMNIIPLSDNYTFRKVGAIDISFADPSLLPGGYYIPRVHVPADNDFSPTNLSSLIAGLTEFLLHETSGSASPTSRS